MRVVLEIEFWGKESGDQCIFSIFTLLLSEETRSHTLEIVQIFVYISFVFFCRFFSFFLSFQFCLSFFVICFCHFSFVCHFLSLFLSSKNHHS